MEETILKHYNKADLETVLTGHTWYERAHNEALLLSQVFEVPLNKVVGLISALSPNNKWQRNLTDAWNLLDKPCITTKCCTFKNQRQKALDILNSDGTDETILKILKGEKTKNFYMNIRYYKTSQAVTVDTWAYRSCNVKPSKKNFALVEEAYKKVAKQLKLMPHQVQAVVWGVVRGEIA